MRLHELVKIQDRKNKRLGRGLGSGKGKTSGRGTKGQKARGKIPATFSGDLSFYKKLPRKRGMGNVKISIKPKPVNLSALNIFKAKSTVDWSSLVSAKIVSEKDLERGVKILAGGEINHALTVKLLVSKGARGKIEKKGGKVENV